ncbi:hypothetical protein DPMN_127754 [Dreissena polymorpha]|uniref:Uncharacterized protein n=1 Tax=Dreissena polymorpha TaxID=45954 RepID=A0A9D4GY67_DREPO|nr:hypothetical protein DPMN_127754 [Dreissena polymorpha]
MAQKITNYQVTSIRDDTFPDLLPELIGGGDTERSDPCVDTLELLTPDLGSTGDTCREEPALLEPLGDFRMFNSTPIITLGERRFGGREVTACCPMVAAGRGTLTTRDTPLSLWLLSSDTSALRAIFLQIPFHSIYQLQSF